MLVTAGVCGDLYLGPDSKDLLFLGGGRNYTVQLIYYFINYFQSIGTGPYWLSKQYRGHGGYKLTTTDRLLNTILTKTRTQVHHSFLRHQLITTDNVHFLLSHRCVETKGTASFFCCQIFEYGRMDPL